jgi:hypothetical protein
MAAAIPAAPAPITTMSKSEEGEADLAIIFGPPRRIILPDDIGDELP